MCLIKWISKDNGEGKKLKVFKYICNEKWKTGKFE